MEFEILRIIVALIGTAAAAYYDVFNKKNVPDKLLYAFLGVALAINVFDPSAFLRNLPVAAVMVVAMYLLYRLGQLGGADVMVLAAIYASIPMIENPLIGQAAQSDVLSSLQMPSIAVVTSMSVLLFAIWIIVRYVPVALRETFRGKAKFGAVQLGQSFLLLVSFGAFVYLFAQLPVFSVGLVVVIEVLFIAAIFFTLYKDFIIGSMVVWKRRPEQEDVLALEMIDIKLIRKHSIGRLVDREQMKRMSKLKRKWPVLDLPIFLPYVLAALILYVLFGNQLVYGLI